MRASTIGIVAALASAVLGLASAAAQTTGNGANAGGGPTSAGSATTSGQGGVSSTPMIGAGANGGGRVVTGTTGTSPPLDGSRLGVANPTAGQLDGVASGRASP